MLNGVCDWMWKGTVIHADRLNISSKVILHILLTNENKFSIFITKMCYSWIFLVYWHWIVIKVLFSKEFVLWLRRKFVLIAKTESRWILRHMGSWWFGYRVSFGFWDAPDVKWVNKLGRPAYPTYPTLGYPTYPTLGYLRYSSQDIPFLPEVINNNHLSYIAYWTSRVKFQFFPTSNNVWIHPAAWNPINHSESKITSKIHQNSSFSTSSHNNLTNHHFPT